MGLLDTVRTAASPVVEATEGVERQVDDEPGGGVIDETDVVSPSLLVSSATFGFVSQDGARDAGFSDTADVDDLGGGLRDGVGAADETFNDFADGVTGEGGTGGAALAGRALRFVAENPLVVLVSLLVLYLVPLLTNAAGVAEGVVGE